MKRTFIVAALFAVAFAGSVPGVPARAETETKVIRAPGNPYLMDFQVLSNKRSDLRINVIRKGLNVAFSEWLRFERPHVYREYAEKSNNEEALEESRPTEATPGVIPAKGNPYLADFQALTNKRVDLRINIARKGLNVAFTEWLLRERPLVYQEYVKQPTAKP